MVALSPSGPSGPRTHRRHLDWSTVCISHMYLQSTHLGTFRPFVPLRGTRASCPCDGVDCRYWPKYNLVHNCTVFRLRVPRTLTSILYNCSKIVRSVVHVSVCTGLRYRHFVPQPHPCTYFPMDHKACPCMFWIVQYSSSALRASASYCTIHTCMNDIVIQKGVARDAASLTNSFLYNNIPAWRAARLVTKV